ncbi:MAG TPA: AAA family ATPase [Candidatus Acidoferrales bacterium]|jgi:predicted ATPase|nr:AAA family ATPase [Candidatus Acidoferrales bacterium]
MFIQRLTLKKLLSFNEATVELGQLNVLIGPNAVGKSNLIEVIGLLQAAPDSLSAVLLAGGVRQWLWLGDVGPAPIATIECDLSLTRGRQFGPLSYQLRFTEEGPNGLVIVGEQLAKSGQGADLGGAGAYLTRSLIQAEFGAEASDLARSKAQVMALTPSESVLAQFKSPVDPTPLTELGRHFSQIRIFREFRTDPDSPIRRGISTSAIKDSLSDRGDNLALVLLDFNFLGVHDRIRDYLRRFCERFEDVKIDVGQGLARTYLREAGLKEMLSAIRMSDGTLKFLALLAALFHPKPPPLICIEEPEIGLHPDALQLVAEALLEASQSVQLIVTTHSDALVDWLTDRPESVLVCERDFDNGTQMKRLSKDSLKAWLEEYTLGELWRKGQIGGNRY